MRRLRVIKIFLYLSIILMMLSIIVLPRGILAQSGVDLVVHYVEGVASSNQVAYEVSVYLSVLDEDDLPLQNSTKENFNLAEDSLPVDIDSLEPVQNEPIHMALLIDTSGSMSGGGIAAARSAASSFVSDLENQDQVAALAFNEAIQTVSDFSTDHLAVRQQIEKIEAAPGSGTCLYDAAYQAVQMTASLPSGRRAVILLTDGVDETQTGQPCSLYLLEDVINLASNGNSRVPVYTLGVGNHIDQQSLERLASLTGGRYLYSPNASQIEAMFLRLADQLRSQYKLQYTSHAGPGAHTLVVGIDYSGLRDFSTRSFLLPDLPTRIEFLYPAPEQNISGEANVSVSVAGQGGSVKRVDFEIDGQLVGSDSNAPYEVAMDFGAYSIGELSITAVARDVNDAALAQTTITVMVQKQSTASLLLAQLTSNTLASIAGSLVGVLVLGIAIFFVIDRRRNRMNVRNQKATQKQNQIVERWIPSKNAVGLLEVLHSDDATMMGQTIEILQPTTTLGRATDNDVFFAKDHSVAWQQAKIVKNNDGLFLKAILPEDESGNEKSPAYNLLVNDVKVGPEPVLLKDSDEIRLGKSVLLRFSAARSGRKIESRTKKENASLENVDERTQDQREAQSQIDSIHSLGFEIGSACDAGRKRRQQPNQDAIGMVLPEGESSRPILLVIADGMGGHAGGEIASRLVVDAICDGYQKTELREDRLALSRDLLNRAHQALRERAAKEQTLADMGCAVVLALLETGRATITNIGDCRAYVLRGKGMLRISRDQSWVEEQVIAGELTAMEARRSPFRNRLTMSVSAKRSEIQPYLVSVPLQAEDVLLLCSDGLWGTLADSMIEAVVRDYPAQQASDRLIEMANASLAPDNISAIVARVSNW